jgi:hypothetical protein
MREQLRSLVAAEQEDLELVKLCAALDHRIGEAQLSKLLLEVDKKCTSAESCSVANRAHKQNC